MPKVPVVLSGADRSSKLLEFQSAYESKAAELVESGKVTSDLILQKNRNCPIINKEIVEKRVEYVFKRQWKENGAWNLFPYTGKVLDVNLVVAAKIAPEQIKRQRGRPRKGKGAKKGKGKAKAKKVKCKTAVIAMLLIHWEEKDEEGELTGAYFGEPDWNDLYPHMFAQNKPGGWYLFEDDIAEAEEELQCDDALLSEIEQASISSDFLHFKKEL